VKQERPHYQDVTPTSDAFDHSPVFAQGPGRLGRQATVPMRPGDDAERAIGRSAVIEVRTHGNERLQHSQGRLDVQNSLLRRPTGAVWV
jgi:hypothetical protein